MTDWYVTLPWATGLVRVENGRVVACAPVFRRWMGPSPYGYGRSWKDVKREIAAKGGHGEPLDSADGYRSDRGAER